ncbi:MAG: hypothetical protein ACM3S5_19085 [Rhodospirillales bacterium]
MIPDVIDGDEDANDRLVEDWPFGKFAGVPVWHFHESLERLARLAGERPRVALGSSRQYGTIGAPKWWSRVQQIMETDSFFEAWLAHGVVGTCWPTSNALFELLQSLGFKACRTTASMRDLGIVNHASAKVALDGSEWLVDSSVLCNVPLLLRNEVFIHGDPVFAAEVEPEASTHIIWAHTPPNSVPLPCRLIHDLATHALYLFKYEESRACSPFNERLYADKRSLAGAPCR